MVNQIYFPIKNMSFVTENFRYCLMLWTMNINQVIIYQGRSKIKYAPVNCWKTIFELQNVLCVCCRTDQIPNSLVIHRLYYAFDTGQ